MTIQTSLLVAAARALGVPPSPLATQQVREAVASEQSLDRAVRAAGLRLGAISADPVQLAVLGAPLLMRCSLGWVALTGSRRGRIEAWLDDGAGVRRRRIAAGRLRGLLGTIDQAYRLESMPIDAMGAAAAGHSPWSRLRALARIERRDIGAIFLYSAAVGLTSLAIPVAVQTLVNTVAFGAVTQSLVVVGIALAAFLCLAAILRVLRFVAAEFVQRRLFVRFALETADRLATVDPKLARKKHLPEHVNRFFDVLTVQKSAAMLLLDGTELLLQATIGLLLLAVYHPALAAFDLVLIAALAVVFAVLGRGASATTLAESDAKYAVAAWLEDVASQPHLFRHPVAARHAVGRADELSRAYLGARGAHFRVVLRQFVGGVSVQVLANVCLLLIGGWLVMQGELTLGQLVAAELVVTLVVASLAKLGKQLESFYDLLAGTAKLGKLVDLTRAPSGGVSLAVGATFTLGRRPLVDITALPDTSAARTIVAAVRGETVEAPIRVNGDPLPAVNGDELRAAAWVVDRPAIVHGTIRENARIGTRRRPSEIDVVLEAFGFEQTRCDQTLLPSGAPLGTCDAIALTLARAVLAGPKLLVVDGALDRLASADRRRLIGALRVTRGEGATLIVSNAPDLGIPTWSLEEITA